MEMVTPDTEPGLVDLSDCTVGLSDAEDRLKAIEAGFGVPDDYEIISVFKATDDSSEMCVEAQPKASNGGGGGTCSVNYLHCFLTAY